MDIYHSLFIHLSLDIWPVSTFWLWWKILTWTWVCKFLCKCTFQLSWNLGVKLLSHMITLCQTVFQNRCTISHSYQQCMGIPISPLPGPKLLSCLLDSCCLVDMKWYLTVVLMCVFVVINEHLFMCFSLCISSLEKYFLDPLPSLKSVHLFYYLVVRVLYIFWIQVSYQIHDL